MVTDSASPRIDLTSRKFGAYFESPEQENGCDVRWAKPAIEAFKKKYGPDDADAVIQFSGTAIS